MTQISGIIPAVNNAAQLQAFLQSGYGMCVLMNFGVSELGGVFAGIGQSGRKALVHCDLIHGLSGDEHAATAIQRVFLIDGSALANSVVSVKKAEPDYVELLPALCVPLLPMLKTEFNMPLIAGGLIQSKEMAEKILLSGVRAVTVSMSTLAKG